MSQQEKLTTEQQQKTFQRLLKKPPNQQCAECGANSPTWVSLDFGIFVCYNCSGAHRALGPSVSRVRSTQLDTWSQDNVDLLDNIGNQIANEYWENKLPPSMKPKKNTELDQMKLFVQDKYLKKLWIPQGLADPKTRYMQCLISGIPFKQTTVAPTGQMPGRPPKPINKVVPHQIKLKTESDQFNMQAFYSDNGSSNWMVNWNKNDVKQQFNTTSGIQVQQEIDLLSSGRNKQAQNNFGFSDEQLKMFKTNPVNDLANKSNQVRSSSQQQSQQQSSVIWSQGFDQIQEQQQQCQQQQQQQYQQEQQQQQQLLLQQQSQQQTQLYQPQKQVQQQSQPLQQQQVYQQQNQKQNNYQQQQNYQNPKNNQPTQNYQQNSFNQFQTQHNKQHQNDQFNNFSTLQNRGSNNSNQPFNQSFNNQFQQAQQQQQQQYQAQSQIYSQQNQGNQQKPNNYNLHQNNFYSSFSESTSSQQKPSQPQQQYQQSNYQPQTQTWNANQNSAQTWDKQPLQQQLNNAEQLKNNPFADSQNILNLYKNQDSQGKKNYDYLKNNPFL